MKPATIVVIFFMSPLIFTLEVISAPKPSGVKPSCLTASWKHSAAQGFRGKEASNPTAYRPWKQPRVGPMCHSYVLTARCDPISITSHGDRHILVMRKRWFVVVFTESQRHWDYLEFLYATKQKTCQHKNNQENPWKWKHQKIMLVHLIISLSGHVISC